MRCGFLFILPLCLAARGASAADPLRFSKTINTSPYQFVSALKQPFFPEMELGDQAPAGRLMKYFKIVSKRVTGDDIAIEFRPTIMVTTLESKMPLIGARFHAFTDDAKGGFTFDGELDPMTGTWVRARFVVEPNDQGSKIGITILDSSFSPTLLKMLFSVVSTLGFTREES